MPARTYLWLVALVQVALLACVASSESAGTTCYAKFPPRIAALSRFLPRCISEKIVPVPSRSELHATNVKNDSALDGSEIPAASDANVSSSPFGANVSGKVGVGRTNGTVTTNRSQSVKVSQLDLAARVNGTFSQNTSDGRPVEPGNSWKPGRHSQELAGNASTQEQNPISSRNVTSRSNGSVPVIQTAERDDGAAVKDLAYSSSDGSDKRGAESEPALAAVGNLFRQWFPLPGSDEYDRNVFADEDSEGNDLGGAATYSELTIEGCLDIINSVELLTGHALGPSDVFYDLGSGFGRLALQVFLTTNVSRVGGVEIGVGRHTVAKAVGRTARLLGPTVYGIGSSDSQVYAQGLPTMTVPHARSDGSPWHLAIGGKVLSIAVRGNEIFAVKDDRRVYKQLLVSARSNCDDWFLASDGIVETIEIHEDTIFAVGADRAVWTQNLHSMTPNSLWTYAARGPVLGIAVHGEAEMIYASGIDMMVYRQRLGTMSPHTEWELAAKGSVERISIHDGWIYGVAYDKRIWKQPIDGLSFETEWWAASRDGIEDVAFTEYGFHAVSDADGDRVGSLPIEFVQGNAVHKIDGLEDASVVYVSSLFFDTPLLMGLGWAVSATLRPGTLVFSEMAFPGCWPGLRHLTSIEVPSSWSSGVKVQVFVVTPPPSVPQPVWMAAHGPASDVAIRALGNGSQSDVVPPDVWAAAVKQAWPGTDSVMLARLAASSVRNVAKTNATSNNTGLILAEARALIQDRLFNRQNGGMVGCAWKTLSSVAALPADSDQGLVSPDLARRAIGPTLEQFVARIANHSLWDSYGRSLWDQVLESMNERRALQILDVAFTVSGESRVPLDVGIELLRKAARLGRANLTRELLQKFDAKFPHNVSELNPLHLASLHGHLQTVDVLLADKSVASIVNDSMAESLELADRKNSNLTRALTLFM